MTPEHEQLVRDTLPLLEAASDRAARSFYERLFALDPSTRAMFQGVDMARQGDKFMSMLTGIVRALDHAPTLVGDVAALGRRHAHLSVTPQHFESAGVALMATIEEVLGRTCTPGVRQAWQEAYHLIAAVMQRVTSRQNLPSLPRTPEDSAPETEPVS